MNNEPNKPIPAQELTEKELESITGGGKEKEISLKNTVYYIFPGLAVPVGFLPGSN